MPEHMWPLRFYIKDCELNIKSRVGNGDYNFEQNVRVGQINWVEWYLHSPKHMSTWNLRL